MVLVLLPSNPSATPIPYQPLQLKSRQNGATEEDEAKQSRNLPRVGVEQEHNPTPNKPCDREHKVEQLTHA